MILAGLGLALSLLRRSSLAITLGCWTASLLLVANLSALHLPGGWFVNTISVAIILFMPTAVFAGYALGQVRRLLLHLTPSRWKPGLQWVLVLVNAAILLLAARALLPILRPSAALARTSDRPAMEWIAEHIPADETILINPMYWGYGTYAGADGGYWITPFTGRKTIPPPVLYALGDPADKQHIRTLCEAVLKQANDPEALAVTLRSQGINYIYLGGRGGVLSPQRLSDSNQFTIIYAQQGNWIFKVQE